MNIVTLSGKTRQGKNTVNNIGKEWSIWREQDGVICLNGSKGMLLRSLNKPLELQWVSLPTDGDFTWVTEQ